MKKILLLSLFSYQLTVCSAQTPFFGCPNKNLAIFRTGNNSATNPMSIYTVDPVTGVPTSVSGSILDPVTGANLQVNGLGINTTDGFLYGINSTSISSFAPGTLPAFYRIGSNAEVIELGNLALPPNPSAGTNVSVINPSAGEADLSDNFYFFGSAAKLVLSGNSFTYTVTGAYIGKLAGVSTLSGSSNTIPVAYTPLTGTDANAATYLATIVAPFQLGNFINPITVGFKDIVFHKPSGKLYSYVTYPNSTNTATLGMLVKIDPVTGEVSSVAAPVTLPAQISAADVAGLLLDKDGNFLILFTNGTVYKANKTGNMYDGSISPLPLVNAYPADLRGDLTSCGDAQLVTALPVVINYFNVYSQGNTAIIKWETASQINTEKFIIERSENGIHWTAVQTIAAAGNASTVLQYSFTDKNIVAAIYFYRLKLVDTDGSINYSEVKNVSFRAANKFFLSYYPNPARDLMYAESKSAFSNTLKIAVNDIIGKVYDIPFKKTAANRLSFDLSRLPQGVYFLKINDGNGNAAVQKIIKQ